MSRPLFAALTAAIFVVLSGCVSQEEYRRALNDSDNLRAQRDALKNDNMSLRADNKLLQTRLADVSADAADTEWLRQQKERLRALLAKLGDANLGDDVRLVQTDLGPALQIEGSVLFSSGQAVVTKGGEQTLRSLIGMLTDSGREIRVDGHTDTDPIRRSSWKSNLELSVARSLAVAALLTAEGVPAERVSVAGYGEYHPVEAGDSKEAKQRNRRVEIVMLNPGAGAVEAE